MTLDNGDKQLLRKTHDLVIEIRTELRNIPRVPEMTTAITGAITAHATACQPTKGKTAGLRQAGLYGTPAAALGYILAEMIRAYAG